MVALVVGVDIMVGAHGILLPSGLVVWEWYTPTVPLDGCGLHSIVKSARTFEPLLLPRRCMIRVRDHLMLKGCDPCHDFRI